MSLFGSCLADDLTKEDSKTPYFKSVPNKEATYDTLEPLLADESWATPFLPEKLSGVIASIFSRFPDCFKPELWIRF